jgi:DNA anti-recombination protein RmuC
MIAWALSLLANPLVRRILLYAAIAAAVLYALRIYGNRQWAKGEAAGRQVVTREIEEQKREEWQKKEAAIAAAAESLEEERRVIRAVAEQLQKDRLSIVSDLERSLAQIRQERNRQYESTAVVADDRLDTALRTVSNELAGAHP